MDLPSFWQHPRLGVTDPREIRPCAMESVSRQSRLGQPPAHWFESSEPSAEIHLSKTLRAELRDLAIEIEDVVIPKLIFSFVTMLRDQLPSQGDEDPAPLYTRSVAIHDLNRDDVDLSEPMQVEIEVYDDEVLAEVPELDLWTSEATESEALLAMKGAIRDLWEDLSEEKESQLGRLPRMWKRILDKKIKVRVAT